MTAMPVIGYNDTDPDGEFIVMEYASNALWNISIPVKSYGHSFKLFPDH